jgi:hypothetical protein
MLICGDDKGGGVVVSSEGDAAVVVVVCPAAGVPSKDATTNRQLKPSAVVKAGVTVALARNEEDELLAAKTLLFSIGTHEICNLLNHAT